MKTIAFYSYKGGVGKSLAATNLAAFFAKIGKNCVLLDMDFEGPSLHHKFIEAESSVGPLGGLLGYLSGHISSPLWPYDDNRDFKVSADAHDLKGFVKEIRIKRTQKNDRTGKIHFVPAGDPFNDTFWETALSPTFKKLFRLFLEHSYTKVKQEEFEENLHEVDSGSNEFKDIQKMITKIKKQQSVCEREISIASNLLLSIKAKIADLRPKPEYLIIDLRSGAFEMTSALLGTWVDTAICMFTLSRDNIRYVTNVMSQAEEKRQAINQINDKDGLLIHEMNIIPVLCRVPTGFEYKYDKDIHELLSSLNKKGDELCILHSDRELEIYESIRLGLNTAPKNVRLSHDYIRLFYEIVKNDGIIGSSDFRIEEFPDKLTIKKLSEALIASNILKEDEKFDTVEELNQILMHPDLHNKIISVKNQQPSDTLSKLKVTYEITKREETLKKLNRYALEEFYQQETPKSQIIEAPNWKIGCEILSNMIELPSDLKEQDRIFLLETDRGALINPNDGSRNVSFKVDTFQRLLLGLEEELGDPEIFDKLLKTAGYKCGSRFGEALVNKWETDVDPVLKIDQVRLQKWCSFDSDVGFGKFELRLPIIPDEKGFFKQADIILRESFLSPSSDTVLDIKSNINNHKFCSFMSGYISGVLDYIIDVDIEVKHFHEAQSDDLGALITWSDSRSESCIFRITRKN